MEDRLRPGIRHLLALLLAMYMLSTFLLPTTARAQSTTLDTQAPLIEIEEVDQGLADRRQVFTVLIEEDVELQSALLYYRRDGDFQYESVPMQTVSDSDFYSATIDTDVSDLRAIEYYVLAVDSSNNRTLSGFAFDPYRRNLQPSPNPSAASSNEPAAPSATASRTDGESAAPAIWQQRWFQITLAVVAAGVIASVADDGGGDDTRLVPLTFNLE